MTINPQNEWIYREPSAPAERGWEFDMRIDWRGIYA
jgi:hypothetical protein